METLLLISGELLLLPVLIAAAVVGELVIGVLLGIVSTILGPLRRRRARAGAVVGRVPGLALLRRLRSWLASMCMAVLVVTLAADFFFFEAALRWVFSRVEDYAGLEVRFEHATGSLIAGRLELTDLAIARAESGGDVVDVQVRRFALDVAMLEILAADKHVHSLEVEGLRGRVERGTRVGGERARTRRPLRVDRLSVSDANLRFVDHTRDRPVDVRLALERLDVAPLRSDMALFDLLYRSNGSGEVDGHRFEVISTHTADTQTATWRAPELPLALLMPYLGAGGQWLEAGFVDLEVRDEWSSRTQPPRVAMHCRLVLHDLRVALPEDLGPRERALAVPLSLAVAKLGREIPLEFSLELSEDRFRDATSLDAIGLWPAASGALAQAMVDETGLDVGRLRRLGKMGGALLERTMEDGGD